MDKKQAIDAVQNFSKSLWKEYLIILLAAFALYAQSITFRYVLDDAIVCEENKFVHKGFRGIWDILSKETFTGYFGEQKNLVAGSRYRPLSLVTFALEHQFLGQNPYVSHAINIVLYALCGVFLFILSRQIFANDNKNKPWFFNFAFIAAILFIFHPIHSEAVANIKGRDEIMCLLFCLMSGYFLVRFEESKAKKMYWYSGLAFALGLFSKENAITYLAVLPLILIYFKNYSFLQSIKRTWIYFAAAILFLIVRYKVIGYFLYSGIKITDLMNDPFIGMNPGQKFATITYTLGWYVKLLFFPHPLTHDYYPYHVPIIELTDVRFWLSFLLNLILIGSIFYFRKRSSLISFSILYYFICISIVSNFFFPVGTFMNERFLFSASVGFSWISSAVLMRFGTKNRPWAMAALVLILAAYAVRTICRVPDWKDGFSLNLSAVKVSPNSARINLFTGVSYFNRYQDEETNPNRYDDLKTAESYVEKSLSIYPSYGQALNMKAGIAAEWYKKDNDLPKFLAQIEKVVEKKPDLSFVNDYMLYLNKNPDLNPIMGPYYYRVGYEILYKKLKRYDFALQYLGWAYAIDKENAELCYKIATVYEDYAKFGKLDARNREIQTINAQQFYYQAAQLDPKYAPKQ